MDIITYTSEMSCLQMSNSTIKAWFVAAAAVTTLIGSWSQLRFFKTLTAQLLQFKSKFYFFSESHTYF